MKVNVKHADLQRGREEKQKMKVVKDLFWKREIRGKVTCMTGRKKELNMCKWIKKCK